MEIRVMEKKRGNKFLYVDSEMRALGKKRAAKLVSLDDPDVEEKAGSWGDLSPVMGTRGIYGFLPNREKSRYLIADRLKPPALPPREDCIDLYGALGVLPFASDGKDYSPNATKPAKPSNPPIIRQTIRTDACPTSMNKAIAVAAGKNAPESLIHLNEGGHYVYTSDFRPQDALSVAYHSDMVPFEMLLQQLRDVKVQGKWLLPTTLSLQLQFYSRPTSPVLRRMLIGGLHVAEEQLGMADVEVLIWDDQTEQLVASGRQTMSMMALPQEMVDAMMKQQGVDRSVLEHGQVLTRL